ncbi:MAG TPA: hypothetical protein VHX15_15545 [Frankiaceae bacterium]|jgi:hypothetical protein|nr:hypothetical protein [Frankiaceae bacterium]
MDAEQTGPRKYTDTDTASPAVSLDGSAWAELDETFFRIVADLFPHSFCSGASALLASNDEDADQGIAAATLEEAPDTVIVIPEARLSHSETLELINNEIDRELAMRRAAMRRHPSRRRF